MYGNGMFAMQASSWVSSAFPRRYVDLRAGLRNRKPAGNCLAKAVVHRAFLHGATPGSLSFGRNGRGH